MPVENKKILLLQTLLKCCDVHALRLEAASHRIAPLLPLKGGSISKLTIDELGCMELLMSRFSKLQDTIGAKLFPLLLQFLQQSVENMSFLDMLHTLEKLTLLHSAAWWLQIRELRNHLIHEYPENPQLMADNFNLSVTAAQELLQYWFSLRVRAEKINMEWLEEGRKGELPCQ